jgi:signal transduction histidine kinase
VRAAHPEANIDVNVEGGCGARVDFDRIEQVVSNLLENAVTHGDRAKGIRVNVTSRPDAISMTVHNHGAPIDPTFLPQLFSPFARGEQARGSSAGLGLGLYVSERIIAAHLGKLSVQSTLEKGTQFEVVLPRRPPAS